MTARLLRRLAYAVGLPGVLFGLWWLSSSDSQNIYLPPLSRILATFGEVWFSERLLNDVLPSLGRLAFGFALAAVLGIGLGVLIGLNRTVRLATEPVLEFFRAIPPPVLVPILMLFAGIEDTMKITVIAAGAVWPVLLNTVEGVRGIDEVLRDTARLYRLRGVTVLWHLVLRSASPRIFTGLRQALSIAVILMVVSEMFAATNGLGFTIISFQRGFAIPEMWSGIILLGLLGVALSLLFRVAERRALSWYLGLRRAQRDDG
ncbi:ABC transporter permease [Crossiella sp. CA198]|uniref:ABC transporter permease n=1 Tax=Crossiella sp. CA198 TaxID=3455607 RepID=UPI003F8D5557